MSAEHLGLKLADIFKSCRDSERPEHFLAEVPHPLGVVGLITVSTLFCHLAVLLLAVELTFIFCNDSQAFNFPIAVAFWNWALSFGTFVARCEPSKTCAA